MKNTILGLDIEDESPNKYEEKYIEDIINGMVELEKNSEDKILYNDIYEKMTIKLIKLIKIFLKLKKILKE